ncbi:sensor histidine kinase [Longimicrobium sp.]|uniref:sensor histidine kinase n=1 Tax=Longimicrobium sp. TaxID=2029185 RepID=UPI002B8E6802|nr:histidine kinase [Longimicrobium sp.]HSU16809.1 histidine kinase [Longimicrobium sp.]
MSLALAGTPDCATTARADAAARPRFAVRWAEVGLMFAAWTLVGAFGLTQSYLAALFGGQPFPGLRYVAWNLESVWLWAAFTPPMFWLAARFPLERGIRVRNLGLHAAFALGFAVLDLGGDVVFGPLLGGYRGTLAERFFAKLFINVFSYAAVVGIAHAVQYNRALAEKREREAALESELLKARLQALEMQIHPHFLFNTLHAVASLIRVKEDQAAIRMLVGLSDLLRIALRNRDAQEVPLREELDFARRYLEVEGIRFEDRLRVVIDVAADAPLDALVPNLILQPLVENAIRHGVEARAAAGLVHMEVTHAGGMLRLRVTDDGPGPKANGRRGVGLANTRERLAHLYGARHRFVLAAGEDGGAVALVEIPLRLATADA